MRSTPGPVRPAALVRAGLILTLTATALVASTPTTTPTADAATPVAAPAAAPAGQVDCTREKCVALTFDDGPVVNTGRVLDELDRAGIKATFFVNGARACQRPDLLQRMAASGMVIGNHTQTHPNLRRLSQAAQQRQVDRAAECIAKAGVPRPTLMRPPYGNANAATKRLGYAVINWDVDSRDWSNRSVRISTANVLRQTRPGSIILMHDTIRSTPQAIPEIVRQLTAKGYRFVTVPELLGSPETGRIYRRA